MKPIPGKALKIIRCTDGLMWYAHKVGQLVPYLGVWEGDGYASLEPAGYTNVVRFEDAEVVDVPLQTGVDQ